MIKEVANEKENYLVNGELPGCVIDASGILWPGSTNDTDNPNNTHHTDHTNHTNHTNHSNDTDSTNHTSRPGDGQGDAGEA